MRSDIASFTQIDAKSLYEVQERYKELLHICPHYGLLKWLQLQTFYIGLTNAIITLVNDAIGVSLMRKKY